MLAFGSFCLDLGNIAWIWAIFRIGVRIGPKGDEALWMGRGRGDGWTDGRTYVRTDVRTDSSCVLQDFVPFGAAALLPLNSNHTLLKQGTGTAIITREEKLLNSCLFDYQSDKANPALDRVE